VKVEVDGEFRRMALPLDASFASLVESVKTPGVALSHFTYIDDEGDAINVRSDADLAEALRVGQSMGRVLKMTAQRGEQEGGKDLHAADCTCSDCKGTHAAGCACAQCAADSGVTTFEERWPSSPLDFPNFDTERMRDEFLIPHNKLMLEDEVSFLYSHCDRLVVGGVIPTAKSPSGVPLESTSKGQPSPLRADFFLERRELVVWNVGGGDANVVVADTKQTIKVGHGECVYVGMGNKAVSFHSVDTAQPAHLYLVSTLAYEAFPCKLVTKDDAKGSTIGTTEGASVRQLYQFVIPGVCQSSQICTGMTVIEAGCVWNTMPCHTHARRTEAYLYFDLEEKMSGSTTDENRICHLMGPPQQSRCLWMSNEEAVVATPGYIHCAAGTQNYAFIWTMAGENPFDFSDMDHINPGDLQ